MFYDMNTVYKRLYEQFHINKTTTESIENYQLIKQDQKLNSENKISSVGDRHLFYLNNDGKL